MNNISPATYMVMAEKIANMAGGRPLDFYTANLQYKNLQATVNLQSNLLLTGLLKQIVL